MTPEQIVTRIRAILPEARVTPEGADCNFSVTVVSSEFDGLSPVKRQQRVLGAFGDLLASGELHALSIHAMTPNEAAETEGLTQISL